MGGTWNPDNDPPAEEFACFNCEGLFSEPKLYCSERCNQEAQYVRYARGVRKDGRFQQPDVQNALKIRLAHVLSGGYPERQRRLSAATRDAIKTRENGCCRICGAPANEIDHIGRSIDGDINH